MVSGTTGCPQYGCVSDRGWRHVALRSFIRSRDRRRRLMGRLGILLSHGPSGGLAQVKNSPTDELRRGFKDTGSALRHEFLDVHRFGCPPVSAIQGHRPVVGLSALGHGTDGGQPGFVVEADHDDGLVEDVNRKR